MEFNRNGSSEPGSLSWRTAIAAASVVLLCVVLPRISGLSSFPTTDEGFYAYYAMRMADSLSSGRGLPSDGFLMIYPLVTSWIFKLQLNPIVLLRLADLLVSAAAGALLVVALQRESRSVLFASVLSAIFLLTMNWAGFVQNGYKNSIFLAYIPLLWALILSQGPLPHGNRRLLAIGALVAIGVLIREPFAGFAMVAVIATWIRLGFRSALTLAVGGCATALLIVIPLVLLRGNPAELVDAYLSAGGMFDSVKDQRYLQFIGSAKSFYQGSKLALLLSAVSLALLLIFSRSSGDKSTRQRLLFWLAVTAVPLVEPALKIGFPYHFASALPGFAGLCALAWSKTPVRRASIPCITAMSMAFFFSSHTELIWKLRALPQTAESARSVATTDWPKETHASSNYLIAADMIRAASASGGHLSVSGFMFPLFPLTGRLPPTSELADLTLTLIELDMDGDALLAALKTCPPDVVMTTTRTEWPGASIIEDVVSRSGLYERFGTVPIDPTLSYGTFGGTVYKRASNAPASCGL